MQIEKTNFKGYRKQKQYKGKETQGEYIKSCF